MLFSGSMADVAVQYPCDMLSMGKGVVVNPDLGVLISLMAFAAFGMGHLHGLGQGDCPLGMAGRTGRLIPLMTFEAGLFGRPESGRVVWVVVNIVVAIGT